MIRLDVAAVQRKFPGRRILHFDVVDSTMTEAAREVSAGCPSGTAVVAEEQTAGQGRHGHGWYSEAGSGLYVSVVLRLPLPPESLPVLTLALGLAAAAAIEDLTGLVPDLRWPNDLMLEGRKAGGILAQLLDGVAVAGIGINVNHAALPEDLAAEATSLRIASGRPHSREELLAALLQSIDSFTKMLIEGGPEPVLRAFSQVSTYARGKRVRVEQSGGAVVGTTAGLDPSGYLRVRRDDGAEVLVLAGGVREV